MLKTYTLLLSLFLSVYTFAQTAYPNLREGNYTITHYTFENGQELAALNLHYYTIGTPQKGKDGKIANAVLIMHGTTSSAAAFLSKQFAGELFGPGQLLDASKYFIILPDAIGHGKSSRPGDSLHMHFPNYTYNDMVTAEHELVTKHLGIDHLRLILGTSMGAMHAWVWGYTYPDFMDALLPLACQPAHIAGRNRMMRKMAIDLIKMDPAWNNGEYSTQPVLGLTGALSSFFFMNSSPLQLQQSASTRAAADTLVTHIRRANLAALDANDVIYALEASRFYDPSPYLSKIKATVYAINSADDEINPAELGVMEREIKKVAHGRYILLPITDKTVGHGTNSLPAIWGGYLKELLEVSAKQ
ncbi:homoserine O-acetyltransferase [Chitinophaga sp. YR627]|uniref:alpha/beta fold hydrolase n=1 Tax=Chitinophaga sp. YR627 TaxID=1881041 RepID=UPI0008EAE0DD|nr:alpha/beta fold hydrolase [Chitinophaga sp. YR627]SFM91292.1 homoserine O-acetyltransferase [Chitinophaga sp. YR627]